MESITSYDIFNLAYRLTWLSRYPNPMREPELSTGEESILVVPDILYGGDAFSPTKILVIDELSNVQHLERILHRVRIENIASTTEAESALSLFKEFQPDLVLIDWRMADVNGRGMVEQLHAAIPPGGFLPIIVLTADGSSQARQLALASGANEVITKPLDACEVVLRIANMVQGRLAHLRLSEQRQALEQTCNQQAIDLKKALADLKVSEEFLAQAQRLSVVGTMASGIAHDFNNTLMLIMGSGEILLGDAERQRLTNENAVPLLQDILTAARDASTLVRQLRKYSRSSGASDVHQPVNLNWLIEQAVSFTKPKWDAQAFGEGSQIRMVVDLHEIPFVLGDAARLRDAVTNLIFNAVDAMPAGGTLTLRTRVVAKWVLLEVRDTGTGMTEEVRQSCFEPFFTTKGQNGTGLGLAMVYGIAQHHSGSIEIASKEGKGTMFTLRLPARPKS